MEFNMKTISAFTTPNDSYPSFINISETDYGSIRITIRPNSIGDSCPNPVEITLTRKDAMRLFTDAFNGLLYKD